MADNSLRTPGSGESIRTVEIGGVKYGVSIPADGVAGTLATVHALHGLGVDVHRRFARIQVTPTISATPYTAGDSLGGEVALPNAVRAAGAFSAIRSLIVANKSFTETPRISMWFADRQISATPTDNVAFDPADADLLFFTAFASTGSSDYRAFADNSALAMPDVDNEFVGDRTLYLTANTGTTAYLYPVSEQTPTLANGDLTFTFIVEYF